MGEIAAAVDMEVQATPVSIAITNQTWCRIPIMLGAPIWHSVVRGHSLGDPSETGDHTHNNLISAMSRHQKNREISALSCCGYF